VIECKPVDQALQDENGVGIARALRIAVKLVEEGGLP
jgi:hypothetical protein